MMDNLQEAYTSYQQALYHLRDPKVSSDLAVAMNLSKRIFRRSHGFGMELAYCMIVTALSTMRKKRSPKSCAWHLISTRPMKSTSDWV